MVRSEAEVERLVHENQRLVHLVVNRYLKKYFVGDMEREDLVSWGLIGLVQAARVWDPERGSLSTIACKAIEWMIVRGVRREWKPDQAAATVSLDELISGEETEGAQERFVDLLAAAQDTEGELLNGETRAAVRSAVAELPAPQRRLIERHYYEAVPVARLAEEWGVSRQGLYARQRQALRQLRAALSISISGEAPGGTPFP
jgi:RNA polymerase sigma factor (sigma-70 family)